MKKKLNLNICLMILILFIISILLYLCNSGKLNWKIMDVVIPLSIFFLTFILINYRSIQKEKNKISILKLLLQQVIDECDDCILILNNNKLFEIGMSHEDFNKVGGGEFSNNMKKLPFKNENTIINLFKEGLLDNNYLKAYFDLKYKYEKYVYNRIALFDYKEYYEGSLKEFLDSKNKFLDMLKHK